MLSNSIEIWLSRTYTVNPNPTKYWNEAGFKNPNLSPCSSLVIFGLVKDKELYFLQHGLIRLVEMSESEGEN